MTTHAEREVLRHLGAAWDVFVQSLPPMHPDDAAEFKAAIHAAQNIIAWRVAARADPETWGQWPKPSAAGHDQ